MQWASFASQVQRRCLSNGNQCMIFFPGTHLLSFSASRLLLPMYAGCATDWWRVAPALALARHGSTLADAAPVDPGHPPDSARPQHLHYCTVHVLAVWKIVNAQHMHTQFALYVRGSLRCRCCGPMSLSLSKNRWDSHMLTLTMACMKTVIWLYMSSQK